MGIGRIHDLGKWKNVLLENAITPIQQYGYTPGKMRQIRP